MHAQSALPVQTHLRKKPMKMTMISHVIALATVLCTCCPRDTTDFSLHKQENRKKKKFKKVLERNIKKLQKKKKQISKCINTLQ